MIKILVNTYRCNYDTNNARNHSKLLYIQWAEDDEFWNALLMGSDYSVDFVMPMLNTSVHRYIVMCGRK